MDRREYLKLLGVATVGATLPGCAPDGSPVPIGAGQITANLPSGSFEGYSARFFTPEEMDTLRVLVDYIIPADERSGSATDARVPEFIDFTAWDRESLQLPLRGGLAWMDQAARSSHGNPFVACSGPQQIALLERVAWPDVAKDEDSHGVAFFTLLRDMTASGFFSSEMGVRDIGYIGNTGASEFRGGCS